MADEVIRACVDQMFDTDEDVIKAMELAIEENPSNLLADGQEFAADQPPKPVELAGVIGKIWKLGRTLRVRFLDGDPQVQAKVQQVAQRWSKFANIKFDFGTHPDAEIRISFAHLGSWSYIGTDALSPRILPDQPTMNYGWLRPDSSDDEYNRVVVHEFGHALGCIHEHSSPVASIPWNKPAVYAYYARHGWSKEKVDRNLFQKYSRELTQFSAYDRNSIMHYPIPKELTDGVFEVGWNRELSETDKAFIGTIYLKSEKPITDLVIAPPLTEASIGQHGEEDLFRFVVSTEASYTIQTEGPTDVTMGLFGPDSQTNLIAQDDDSGQDLNAKIVASLMPGTYYIRLRHYAPTRTGKYAISVRAA